MEGEGRVDVRSQYGQGSAGHGPLPQPTQSQTKTPKHPPTLTDAFFSLDMLIEARG